MKNVIAGAVALMVTTMTITPIVVAENTTDSQKEIQKVATNEKRDCLLDGNSWSICFASSSVDSYHALERIITDASRENLGAGLGTDSAVQSIRKKLAKGLLY